MGDGGWTFAHDNARKAVEKEFGDKVVTSFVEKVPESADAERVIRDMAGQGNKLIFGTTFGYMEPILKVANDLKDLAADEKVWMVVTYQSTIEDREWLNDERNVLTEYNCSEAKGLARPCTHLISLNQSSAERKENVMRLHVAKSRFFKKGDTIRIATDYDNEVFYDGQRTLNLNRE